MESSTLASFRESLLRACEGIFEPNAEQAQKRAPNAIALIFIIILDLGLRRPINRRDARVLKWARDTHFFLNEKLFLSKFKKFAN